MLTPAVTVTRPRATLDSEATFDTSLLDSRTLIGITMEQSVVATFVAHTRISRGQCDSLIADTRRQQ
jgi:hypothetical protein